MTKLRTPDSIEDAVHQAIALLGAETISMALAAIGIRASVSLLTKWADPDAEQNIGLHQALAIESLLLKAGHAAIFPDLFARLGSPATVGAEGASALRMGARLVGEAADMLEAIERAEADGFVDPAELSGLLAQFERVQKLMPTVRRSLFRRQQKPKRADQRPARGALT